MEHVRIWSWNVIAVEALHVAGYVFEGEGGDEDWLIHVPATLFGRFPPGSDMAVGDDPSRDRHDRSYSASWGWLRPWPQADGSVVWVASHA